MQLQATRSLRLAVVSELVGAEHAGRRLAAVARALGLFDASDGGCQVREESRRDDLGVTQPVAFVKRSPRWLLRNATASSSGHSLAAYLRCASVPFTSIVSLRDLLPPSSFALVISSNETTRARF